MAKYTIIEDEDLDQRLCCSMAAPAIPSGKKVRVVITCIMLDVPMAVEPTVYYEADRVHLIHSSKNHRGGTGHIYCRFFEEARAQIEERAQADIVEHDANVYDFHAMMRCILEILNEERKGTGGAMDVYVNISSGSTEYSAAAMLVCMQYRDLTAFTVRTDRYMLSAEDVNTLLYKDGRPVGFSASVEDPKMVVTFDPDKKDADLVACLGVLKDIKSRKREIYFMDVINELKIIGAWNYEPKKKRYKTDDLQNERMHLKRAYLEPMIKKGWVKENDLSRDRWDITPDGEAIIEVYHGLE
jgi:hypothetical protein